MAVRHFRWVFIIPIAYYVALRARAKLDMCYYVLLCGLRGALRAPEVLLIKVHEANEARNGTGISKMVSVILSACYVVGRANMWT